MYFGAIGFVAAFAGFALAQGRSWLPLWVQIVLVLVMLHPWTPTVRRRIVSPLFLIESLGQSRSSRGQAARPNSGMQL